MGVGGAPEGVLAAAALLNAWEATCSPDPSL
ncbi:MAG: hypothetical protein AB7F20_06535 [Geoalkalibacter sp.]